MRWLRRLLRRRRGHKYPTYGERRRTPRLESKSRSPGEMSFAPRRYGPPRRKRKRRIRRFFWRLAKYGTLTAAAALIWFSIGLPDIEELNKFTKAPSILIQSEDGRILGSFGDIYGDYVPFKDLPASLVDSVIATEDRNFYHHFGIDPFGMARAMLANIRAGRIVQGGSTITQQVAKNVFLTPERSVSRKIREMILAFKLERRFTKEEILSIYLNRVYLGAGNYGVDAAAKRYFGKSARELTLSESAILAGLLKAPSRFAPTANPELAKKRADQVLVNMQAAGFLTQAQCDRARAELTRAMKDRRKYSQSTLYFADWIAEELPEFVGNVSEDMVVTVTLDPDLQVIADKAIAEVMDKEAEKYGASQAALVAVTPDGAVRAMVGGRSYGDSQFNRAVQALRQPGSAFKLFVYLAGLEAGFTPDMVVEDQPVSIPIVGGVWQPHNYSGRYEGPMPIRLAVAESINSVAVQVAMAAGLERVIGVAHRLGITSDIQEVPSIALGSTEVTLLELTAAYAHLAAGGAIVNPYGIVKITTASGTPLYERRASPPGRVLSPAVVGMMNDMLSGVIENGTGRGARIGRPAAGKTGTTSDYRDAWFMGYTSDLAAGVWVGNDDNSAMKKVTGGTLPAPIWGRFMAAALADKPARGLPTGGWGGEALPWENDTPRWPVPAEERRRPSAQPAPSGGELGPSFWEKLFR